MAKYKLTYFDIVGGLGEPIRLILAYIGKDFEDCRLNHATWPETKKKIPFGKLPTLEMNGKVYSQSTAIARYLAIEAGLSGKTALENLEIDMIVGTFFDFSGEISTFHHQKNPELKEEQRKKIINETLPFYFSLYEQRVKQNGYVANKALSCADIFLISNLEKMEEILEEKFMKNYPSIVALKEKIFQNPNIKKWKASRA